MAAVTAGVIIEIPPAPAAGLIEMDVVAVVLELDLASVFVSVLVPVTDVSLAVLVSEVSEDSCEAVVEGASLLVASVVVSEDVSLVSKDNRRVMYLHACPVSHPQGAATKAMPRLPSPGERPSRQDSV